MLFTWHMGMSIEEDVVSACFAYRQERFEIACLRH